MIFRVCQMFFLESASTDEIAKWVQAELHKIDRNIHFKRQQVYPVIFEAIKRGYIKFTPPTGQTLEQRLADLVHTDKTNITVSKVAGSGTTDHLASVAADNSERRTSELTDSSLGPKEVAL